MTIDTNSQKETIFPRLYHIYCSQITKKTQELT